MSNLSHLTLSDLRAWSAKQDPSKRNPTVNGQCLYNGPDNTHCIVGQFLVDHGISDTALTIWEGKDASYLVDHYQVPKALGYILSHMQDIADYGDEWESALAIVEEY